ncbi:AAA family ATPase [Anoxybacteroides rupiense]|uniref:AAA family ATPase n=1 Tax=Anoxybacteroides rupiense TaxID=311460 RepID=UPI003FA52FE6
MLKKIYLPKLKRIKITDYSLYIQQPSFEFSFDDGINAIVGVNGIGKTTFIELIMYSLVGFRKEYKTKKINGQKKLIGNKEKNAIEYFKSRFNPNYNNNKNAQVTLEFIVGEHNFLITRSLYEDRILSLEVNGQAFDIESEEDYERLLTEKTGLSNFKSLQTVIRKFLLFDEQRLNVAWDTDTQDEILRILFFDEEMFVQFELLENLVTELDSKGRHLSEDRRIIKEKYGSLIAEKEKLLQGIQKREANDNEDLDYLKLMERKNSLELKVEEIDEKIEELRLECEEKEEELNRLLGERNSISQVLERHESEISKLESTIYNSIYESLPDYYLSLEKSLINDGYCLICNSKSKEIKEKFLNNKQYNRCLICESELQKEFEIDESLIEKLNELVDAKERLIIRLNNKEDEVQSCRKDWQRINNELNMLLNEKESISEQMLYIDSLLAEKGSHNNHDTYSQILKKLKMEESELTEQINSIYRQRDEAAQELKNLQKKFVDIIDNLNSKISSYFNKYASTFIGLECELTVKHQKIKRVPHIKFLPRINGDERHSIYSVSESQRFFLDQAFRMAIIDYLQNSIPKFSTFFITETPEGSLDIAYEKHVAEMFLLFAQSNNNIVFTSNLNSSRFLQKIFEGMDHNERRRKILNMLEKGNLTMVQQKNIEQIEGIIKSLHGDGEENG